MPIITSAAVDDTATSTSGVITFEFDLSNTLTDKQGYNWYLEVRETSFGSQYYSSLYGVAFCDRIYDTSHADAGLCMNQLGTSGVLLPFDGTLALTSFYISCDDGVSYSSETNEGSIAKGVNNNTFVIDKIKMKITGNSGDAFDKGSLNIFRIF